MLFYVSQRTVNMPYEGRYLPPLLPYIPLYIRLNIYSILRKTFFFIHFIREANFLLRIKNSLFFNMMFTGLQPVPSRENPGPVAKYIVFVPQN